MPELVACDYGLKERLVAWGSVPPADGHMARDHVVAEALLGEDVAAERDLAELSLTHVSPTVQAHAA